jgi:hypothetical protein
MADLSGNFIIGEGKIRDYSVLDILCSSCHQPIGKSHLPTCTGEIVDSEIAKMREMIAEAETNYKFYDVIITEQGEKIMRLEGIIAGLLDVLEGRFRVFETDEEMEEYLMSL